VLLSNTLEATREKAVKGHGGDVKLIFATINTEVSVD
jgi:hypothetical protein